VRVKTEKEGGERGVNILSTTRHGVSSGPPPAPAASSRIARNQDSRPAPSRPEEIPTKGKNVYVEYAPDTSTFILLSKNGWKIVCSSDKAAMRAEGRSADMRGRANLGWGQRAGKGRERDGGDQRKVEQRRHDEWQGRAGREDTVWEGCRTIGERDAPLLKRLCVAEDVRGGLLSLLGLVLRLSTPPSLCPRLHLASRATPSASSALSSTRPARRGYSRGRRIPRTPPRGGRRWCPHRIHRRRAPQHPALVPARVRARARAHVPCKCMWSDLDWDWRCGGRRVAVPLSFSLAGTTGAGAGAVSLGGGGAVVHQNGDL
jgi:hypothetical protein